MLFEFINDLLKTFPELEETLDESLREIYNNYSEYSNSTNESEEGENENTDTEIKSRVIKAGETVFNYCNGVFPERFFDILYKNEDMI